MRRRGGQNDNYGSVLTAHPGSRRGGQLQTTGSQPIVSATACPTSFLPEAPVPEQPATLTRPPDATTPRNDLHAPTTTRDRTARLTCEHPTRALHHSFSQARRSSALVASSGATSSAVSSTNTNSLRHDDRISAPHASARSEMSASTDCPSLAAATSKRPSVSTDPTTTGDRTARSTSDHPNQVGASGQPRPPRSRATTSSAASSTNTTPAAA
jgi:hypothetical protein